jgi:intracellular septation protein A
MANTQAMCNSFKVDLFNAVHAFNATGIPAHTAGTADVFKAALYVTTATVNSTTTAYSATNEVTGTGYTAGGVVVTFGTAPSNTTTTAFLTPSATITYTTVTLSTSFDAMLLYNNTNAGKNSVAVFTFTAQTVSAGTFSLTMPTNDATTGLLRLA